MDRKQLRKMTGIAARIICHGLGVVTVFFLTFWVNGTDEVARALGESWHYGFLENNQTELLIQLGLSTCLWAIIAIGASLFQSMARERKTKKVTRLQKAKGAVMTETLIVFPVLLLISLGLLQLTLNNTAAIFTSLAAFQAGRTVYVWDPETDPANGRNGGQSHDEVEERARIAAASVIAPVAPSNYSGSCDTSPRFDSKLEAMMSVTLGAAGAFGSASAGAVKAAAAGRPVLWSRNQSVDRAYDTDKFEIRGPVKMYLAYCQTEVTYEEENGGYNKTYVTYDHRITMPMIGYIFGQRRALGYFARIERSYVLPKQIPPNASVPTSIFSLLAFNPFADYK